MDDDWPVEVMIAAYNHVYRVVYGSIYMDRGAVRVTDYGDANIGAAFQIEFLALDCAPDEAVTAVNAYPVAGRPYVIDAFHDTPTPAHLLAGYAALGYDYLKTVPVMAVELPAPLDAAPVEIAPVATAESLAHVNAALSADGEHIPPAAVSDPYIVNLCAWCEGQVAGWAQMVTAHAAAAYINQMYTLTAWRRRGVATALLHRIHMEAAARGFRHVVLIPSVMARSLYKRSGYRSRSYYSVFAPRTGA